MANKEALNNGYKVLTLNTNEDPYPAVVKGDHGKYEIGVANHRVEFHSAQNQDRARGDAIREMPIPHMVNGFLTSLAKRGPAYGHSQSRLEISLGDTGCGKTHEAKLIGRMRHPEGSVVWQGTPTKGLGSIFYAPIISSVGELSMLDRIENRKRLDDFSKSLLSRQLGEAFSDDGKNFAFDRKLLAELDVKLVVDTLETVAKIEELDKSDLNALGMEVAEMEAWKALDEGRELLIDEVNKAKPGSATEIQEELQVLGGQGSGSTIVKHGFESRELNRKEFPVGFYVTMTGNETSDGFETNDFAESTNRRIRPLEGLIKLDGRDGELPAELAWEHRISQYLTGLPVSTLYYSRKSHWDSNPEEFKKYLKHKRVQGLSDEEINNIPDQQWQLLDHWPQVILDVQRKAEFYHAWRQLVDPDSPIYEHPELQELSMEVDEEYKKRVSIDLTYPQLHIDNAIVPSIEGVSTANGLPIINSSMVLPKEDLLLHFADRRDEQIIESIVRTTACKPLLRQTLLNKAADCGITSPKYNQTSNPGDKPLNIDIFKGQPTKKQAHLIRDMLVEHLKSEYPDLPWSSNKDDVLSVKQVERAIARLQDQQSAKLSPQVTALQIPNIDLDTLGENPFTNIVLADSMPFKPSAKSVKYRVYDVPEDQLAEHDTLLAALALPALSTVNVPALFNEALTASDQVVTEDEAVKIAENRSDTGLAMTTILTKQKGRTSPIHVVRSNDEEKTLVVGSKVDKKLQRMLDRSGITYVDYNQPNAAALVNKAVADMQSNQRDPRWTEDALKGAFLLRNGHDEDGEQHWRQSLGELMTNPNGVPPVNPNFATKMHELKDLQHLASMVDEKQSRAGGIA